ncbi:E3 ubiquitin/ISG15 ligase TRIM25-like, partial [Tachysurus ichikawai]
MAEAVLTANGSFCCSVCLDLLTDPVTIPCGHSFCLSCINGCWDHNRDNICPQCRQKFTPRPVLNKNTMLAELAEALRTTRLQAARVAVSYARPGDIGCDFCTENKHKAVKSCLVCLASYCEAHVQTHYNSPALKNHKLVEASVNLQQKICSQHGKLLEIFCRTDQRFICCMCVVDEHSGHNTVLPATERAERQMQLVESQKESQQRIREREKKLQELKQYIVSLGLSAQEADKESEQLFDDLIQSIEKTRSEVKELIQAQEKAELRLLAELIKNLEQELADLRKRNAEMEKLSHTDDHIHFLQSLQFLCVPLGPAELPKFPIRPKFSLEELRKAVSGLTEQLEKFDKLQLVQFEDHSALLPEPKTREDFMKYFCQLTLDPNTAHHRLSLSEKNRKVSVTRQAQKCPDHPERFDMVQQVLCKETLSGRCYWEVEQVCKFNSSIAVSYKSISRKGKSNESNFEQNDKSWSFTYFKTKYFFRHNNKDIEVPVETCSSRIGVYLDHRAGTLSFYSISDTMTLLYRAHTTFTRPLYAGFQIYGYDNYFRLCS